LPILRVETENVKSAGHGATIAPFDEEMFFYLESRGIDPEEGKK
jgi:Fe-S cluster assembly scaffold protein SufB